MNFSIVVNIDDDHKEYIKLVRQNGSLLLPKLLEKSLPNKQYIF